MIDLQTVPKKEDAFTQRELGNETIFLSPEGSRIHALDEVGTFIWKQIDGTACLSEVRDSICKEYDVEQEQAEKDLLEFITDLVGHKLLAVD